MHRTSYRSWLLVAIFTLTALPSMAQEFEPDAHTLLLLHANGSTQGAQGENPTLATGVGYAAGIFGQAFDLPTGARLRFTAANNIQAPGGTLEFWFRPNWNGNDGTDHWILSWGTSGGLLMGKDGGDFWRIIANRYGPDGHPECGTGLFVTTEWVANQWHHCAFTWNAERVEAYVDGRLRAAGGVGFTLPAISAPEFQISGEGTGGYLAGRVDELRISDVPRSAEEIADSYLRGIQILELTITPDPLELLETWVVAPEIAATTNLGALALPPSALTWVALDGSVAGSDEQGRVVGLSAGTTSVIGSIQSVSDTITVTVSAPVLPPEYDHLDHDLTVPMAGAVAPMPVVVIRYFPTQDGIGLDPASTGVDWPLVDIRGYTNTLNRRVKFMLEEGSRFRGYANPEAPPFLGYQIVDMITVYEPLPRGKDIGNGSYYPDYDQILSRFDARHYVEDLGVKEFWLWGYHSGEIAPAESNMASPTTGDISNSYRFEDDLPVFDRTYVLYNYNFTRSQAEAVHNHGHQLEAILAHLNQQQDGNTELFWQRFVGQDGQGNFTSGRCGWTHMPPNTTDHYDYLNPTFVASDIAYWRPDGGGATTLVNLDTWGDIPYAWPENPAEIGQRIESQWYIYWMQAMPGLGNALSYGGQPLTNWWMFTAFWDTAIDAGLGLYGNPVGAPALPAGAAPVLHAAYPNPFNPRTTIAYELAAPAVARLAVYDPAGRLVAVLLDERLPAGSGQVDWDGRDAAGHPVASGVYLARFEAGKAVLSARLVLLR